MRYDVVLTYGGALGKQQYLMRRETNRSGSFSYFVLPLQYNYRGDSTMKARKIGPGAITAPTFGTILPATRSPARQL